MASAIDMASNALILIGDDPINALSENTAASNLYNDTYQLVLSQHPWTFALKEQFLSKLTQAPDRETGYSTAFRRPTDLIRLWALLNVRDYKIVGENIYANSNTAFARYVHKVDESYLPSQVVKTIEYKLASELSISVAEDEQKAQIFEQKYIAQLGQAMAADAQQQPQDAIRSNPIRMMR
jgi:hypothetical protein